MGRLRGGEMYRKSEEKLDLGRYKFTGQFARSAVKLARMGTELVRIALGSQHAVPVVKVGL